MRRCHSNARSESHRVDNLVSSKSNRVPPQTPESYMQKCEKKMSSNQHYLKGGTNKQHNVASEINTVRYSPIDDSLAEINMKTSNPPKQRSKSTVSDRKPWGQLLTKHTNAESESVFGKFDPLRTLHFLARELQTHMQAKMPEESNMQEIITAMHAALKRIPPEVASTVQLQQQALDLLPTKLRKSVSKDSFDTCNLGEEKLRSKEIEEIHKLIEGSAKLEASCKHLENIYGQLSKEKSSLESMFQQERANSKVLQIRVEDLENENKQLSHKLNKKDEETEHLKATIATLEVKLQEKTSFTSDVKATLGDIKKTKANLEQENLKLEHQLNLSAIEKEKLFAILAVRDKQIFEIKNEMTQLQQAVDEQLVELHNCALGSVPGNGAAEPQNKLDKVTADTISSIWSNDQQFYSDDEENQQPTKS